MGVLAYGFPPSGAQTPSNKNRAGVWTGPWQRMEAAGLVAGLFGLAAQAPHDPEDY